MDKERLCQAGQDDTHQQVSHRVHPADNGSGADHRGDRDRLPAYNRLGLVYRGVADPATLTDIDQVAVVGDEKPGEEVHDGYATQVDYILQEDQVNVVHRHAANLDEHEANAHQDHQDNTS